MKDYLVEFLRSLYKYTKDCRFEVIVVDNAGDDDTAAVLRRDFPAVRIIETGKRLGFSEARKFGLKECSGRYIVLANCDLYINSDAFGQMHQFLKRRPEACGCAPLLLTPDGKLQTGPAGYLPGILSFINYFFFLSYIFPRRPVKGFYLRALNGEQKEVKVDWLSGASAVYKKEFLLEAAFPDKDELIYFEDVQIGRQARERGQSLYYYPAAEVYHHQGIALGPQRIIDDMNNYLKLYNPRARRLMLMIAAGGFLLRSLIRRGKKRRILFNWARESFTLSLRGAPSLRGTV